MPFDFNKQVSLLVTIGTSMIVATAVVIAGIVANEERIKRVENNLNAFLQKRILPEAEVRITALEYGLDDHTRRIAEIEAFKNTGPRCTANDCKRIENRLNGVASSQTGCLADLSTLKYRMNKVEEAVSHEHRGGG